MRRARRWLVALLVVSAAGCFSTKEQRARWTDPFDLFAPGRETDAASVHYVLIERPVGEEINTCRGFLKPTLGRFPNLAAVVTLGAIAHQSVVRALGARVAALPFRHGARYEAGTLTVFPSYHCSRYNTNTGVLTEAMFVNVFRAVAEHLKA